MTIFSFGLKAWWEAAKVLAGRMVFAGRMCPKARMLREPAVSNNLMPLGYERESPSIFCAFGLLLMHFLNKKLKPCGSIYLAIAIVTLIQF